MPDAIYLEVGKLVRRKREARGMTQGALAAKVNLSRTSITNIESGAQAVPLHQIIGIAQALMVDPSELIPNIQDQERMARPSNLSSDFSLLLRKLDIKGDGR
jgi:transcriptional regulator with XRE-family HTH domain